MGIHINLFIQAYHISPEDWESVYKETCEILKHTPFMDCYTPGFSSHPYWDLAATDAEGFVRLNAEREKIREIIFGS